MTLWIKAADGLDRRTVFQQVAVAVPMARDAGNSSSFHRHDVDDYLCPLNVMRSTYCTVLYNWRHTSRLRRPAFRLSSAGFLLPAFSSDAAARTGYTTRRDAAGQQLS